MNGILSLPVPLAIGYDLANELRGLFNDDLFIARSLSIGREKFHSFGVIAHRVFHRLGVVLHWTFACRQGRHICFIVIETLERHSSVNRRGSSPTDRGVRIASANS